MNSYLHSGEMRECFLCQQEKHASALLKHSLEDQMSVQMALNLFRVRTQRRKMLENVKINKKRQEKKLACSC